MSLRERFLRLWNSPVVAVPSWVVFPFLFVTFVIGGIGGGWLLSRIVLFIVGVWP